MTRRASSSALAALAILSSLALAGCDDLFNTLFDTLAPIGVSASDGDYPDRVEVSWAAPDLSADKWEGYEVDYYEVIWSCDTGEAGTGYTSSTSYTIPVAPEDCAHYYDVTVTSHCDPSGGGSASDDGFAMDADPLVWQDGGSYYEMGERDLWFETMLQEGFQYELVFSGGDGHYELYPFRSLDEIGTPPIADGRMAWTCDDDGYFHKFYVRVVSETATRFFARCDNGYGF